MRGGGGGVKLFKNMEKITLKHLHSPKHLEQFKLVETFESVQGNIIIDEDTGNYALIEFGTGLKMILYSVQNPQEVAEFVGQEVCLEYIDSQILDSEDDMIRAYMQITKVTRIE